jgi:hypothetical protein
MRLKPTSCSSIATAGLDAVASKSRLMGKFCGYNCVMGVTTVSTASFHLNHVARIPCI